ncbi:ABC transporter substrate-binding protein [Halopenitus sp. POP-27]|uniref:substrate-binding domain-containing protein n=1 Tax=Halopenitus sp. POP-27 TaxID=2994425 RepID=UPI002469622D|nr:ABC transporter substrate-binding protein [Halopenitus sp. POP-27]
MGSNTNSDSSDRQIDSSSGNSTDDGSRRDFLRTTGAGIAIASVAGCLGNGDGNGNGGGNGGNGGNGGGNGDGSGDGLTIGFYNPLSGPNSNIGEQKQIGAEMSRDIINEAGGVHGQDIELVFGDSESQPSAGRNEVNRLIQQEGVDVIGGGFHSDVALATVEVTAQHDVPQIIDEAVSNAIVEKINDQELWNVFKTTPPSEAYAVGWRQLIDQFQNDGTGYFPYEDQTIALIGEDTSYGLSIMDLMRDELDEIGWEVVSQDEVALDETDFTSLLSRIQSNDPDIVWAVQTSSSGAGNLTRQFAESGFEGTHFFHNYGLTIGDALETAGSAGDGAITLLNAGRVDALLEEQGALEAWNERTDLDMTGSAALSYQNIKVIAEYVSAFESLEAFRSASVDEWESTVLEHDPIPGGTGYISYQDNHQAAWGGVDTQPAPGYQVIDQELNLVWPSEIATAEIDTSVY